MEEKQKDEYEILNNKIRVRDDSGNMEVEMLRILYRIRHCRGEIDCVQSSKIAHEKDQV